MAAYVVVRVEVLDPKRFGIYQQLATASVEKFGGRFLRARRRLRGARRQLGRPANGRSRVPLPRAGHELVPISRIRAGDRGAQGSSHPSHGGLGRKHSGSRSSPVIPAASGSDLPVSRRSVRTGNLGGVDQSPPAPTDAEQPGPRRRDRRRIAGRRRRRTPTGEPPPRRRRIDRRQAGKRAAGLREVPARVQQHVGNRVPDLPRRPQHVHVAAIGEHAPSAVKDAVHATREARGDRLHPAREVPSAGRLDDHVHVVVLDRVVNQPKPAPLARLAPASLQLGHQPRSPERRNVLAHLQRDVTRMPACQRRSPPVRIPSRRSSLPPRTDPRTAPPRPRLEFELQLPRSQRHARDARTPMCQIRSRDPSE